MVFDKSFSFEELYTFPMKPRLHLFRCSMSGFASKLPAAQPFVNCQHRVHTLARNYGEATAWRKPLPICVAPFLAFTLIEMLVTLAVVAIVSALLLPAFSVAKRKAESVRCISNLHQLFIAVRMYADSNSGHLPYVEEGPSATTNSLGARQTFALYTAGNGGVFKCPSDKQGTSETMGSSYEWNTSLNGHLLFRVGVVYLFQDRQAWHPRGKNEVRSNGYAGPQNL
jgi:prepilin-type N-terminal cleavage/methylation domain-containing protein